MTKKTESGLFIMRSFASRRDVLKGAAIGTAGLALSGSLSKALAATDINMVVWQGYDDA
ncbi:MAG: twin-arginine translocation signal domain-containing protein, partial [bacterium]|nr:twin-arginine translocation signal domain-containing protein [bacterium]